MESMQAEASTRTPAKLLIGALCAAAAVLVAVILSGSRFDNDSARAVGMAVAVAGFTLTGAAGLGLARKRPGLALIGVLTAVLSLAAFLAVSALLWGDLGGGPDARVAGATIILALAGGHLSVLLASSQAADPEGLRLLRGGVVVCLGALALMAIVELAEHGEQLDWRLIGVVAVLYVLGTLLLPVVRHAAGPADAAIPASPAPPAPWIAGIDHVVVAVSDRRRSDWFYRDVLGAAIETGEGGRVAYRFAGQRLNVHEPGIAASPLAADPVRPGNTDICLVWSGSAQAALEHLHRCGIEVVGGPVPRQGAGGPGLSVYCRDPDGSLVELISYSSQPSTTSAPRRGVSVIARR